LVLLLPGNKCAAVRKPRHIKDLLEGDSKRLTSLRERLQERSRILDLVIAALPEELAANVASAGIDQGELTVGAASAAWATRLRYMTDTLRERVGGALGVEISSIRIKVYKVGTRSPP
jgi:hypothetical protein